METRLDYSKAAPGSWSRSSRMLK